MKLSAKKSSVRSFYVFLAGIAFALNWVWEIAQMSAYRTPEKSWGETLFFCTLATFIDVLAVLAIHGTAVFFINRRDWKFYLIAALLGAVCAVMFENIAFAFGWWRYETRMIVVPNLGTGFLPFVQLTTLVPVSIWLATKASRSALEHE